MKNKKTNQLIRLLCVAVTLCLAVMTPLTAFAGETQEKTNKILINEIESNDANGGNDWVEIINSGDVDVDISGFYITDDKGEERVAEASTYPLQAGTVLKAGEVLVLEETVNFDFGLGKADTVMLFNAEGDMLDTYSWTSHAEGTYSRTESGEFIDQAPTKGKVNTPEISGAMQIVINEVESNGDATDWVEIYNSGDSDVDISGWYICDNDPTGHIADVIPVARGTVLKSNSYYVFESGSHFNFGLGKEDCATVYNADGEIVASYEWTAHANGVYARIPDGIGDMVDFDTPTKGKPNVVANPVVINEVQSKDPNGGPDWIELANPTASELDISGIVIKDDDDSHGYVIPENTVIPAKGFIVFTEEEFGFGLGKNDSVRLFENGTMIASTTWEGNTNPTWGLYPNASGKEYRNTLQETPGSANIFEGIPQVIAWPGPDTVITSDMSFLEDSSGLDFYNGKLYAVDNGTGRFWILDVEKDGTLSFAKGFENGKTVNFTEPTAKGPDAEGITVDGNGFVYLASERNNSEKGVNYNVILKADPNAEGDSQNALQQWDLTDTLPDVVANMGIEAVEWVSNSDLKGVLFDENTNSPFDSDNYPNATADGVFFVALEANGHVYAYVLNEDSSVVQIADIDPKLGGAMGLDYDTYEKKLWVAADDGYGNVCAVLKFNGTSEPDVVHIAPAADLDVSVNNEGFAIAGAEFTVNGQRPVYHFADGVASGALTISYIYCDYKEEPAAVYGDADGNGVIDVADATLIQRACVGLEEIDSTVCDVNSDGQVNIQDVTLIQKYVARFNYATGKVGLPIAD